MIFTYPTPLGGVGLAAPQVGVKKVGIYFRILVNRFLVRFCCQSMAVIYIPKSLSGHGIEPQPMHEIINPSYSPVTEELATQTEGCYSVRYEMLMMAHFI